MKKALIGLSFLLFFSQLPIAYAQDIDLTEFDDRIGAALGVGAFGGGLILSFTILFFFLGVLGIVTRKKPTTFMVLLLGFSILSACIAFGWFPVWSLVFLVLMVAIMFGTKIVKAIR